MLLWLVVSVVIVVNGVSCGGEKGEAHSATICTSCLLLYVSLQCSGVREYVHVLAFILLPRSTMFVTICTIPQEKMLVAYSKQNTIPSEKISFVVRTFFFFF